MTVEEIRAAAAEALDPLERWAKNCHAASLELVRAGVAYRVARGWCAGVGSQHSWAVVSVDCYDLKGLVIDAVRWSYQDPPEPSIYVGPLVDSGCQPHGAGSIWEHGRPAPATGAPIELTPRRPLSPRALTFLRILGPLDRRGWSTLVHSPVQGWPAAEIIGAVYETKEISALVPIDIVGMVTEHNPSGLYLKEAS